MMLMATPRRRHTVHRASPSVTQPPASARSPQLCCAVPTRILSAADVRRLLDRDALLESLRDAFAAYSTSRTVAAQRAGSALPGPGGRTVMVVYPGPIDGIPAC